MSVVELLQSAFPLSSREVNILIYTAPKRYKVHNIEKRNGRGIRTIAQPTPELKLVQKWLVSHFLKDLPIHEAAMAYRLGRGIKDHAQMHAVGRYLLKLDFKDFFPSIKAEDLAEHTLRHLKLDVMDQVALSQLLFRKVPSEAKLSLSIGAPSSPFISNAVMFGFDEMVAIYCDSVGVKYSRYADDLAFSTNKPFILSQVREKVVQICKEIAYPRLALNDEKTVFTSKKHNRHLTGLVLSNEGKASLGREKKREIRAMAHHFLQNKLPIVDHGKLRGLIAFSASVDKDFVTSIRRMMGERAYLMLVQG